MIQWPCIFKLNGDAELMFMSSEIQLSNELDALIWDSSDRLIDVSGQCYAIKTAVKGYRYEPEGERLSLEAVTHLVREHEFSKAAMCITKIQFPSIQQAIMSLANDNCTPQGE